MWIRCVCGTALANTGWPNDTEHLLVGSRALERLQDLVDGEVQRDGVVDMWPEHWEQCGAQEIWKCHHCDRLLINPGGPRHQVIVYAIERTGLQQ